MCIPSKYIRDFLCSSFKTLENTNNIERFNNITNLLNTEVFFKIIFDDYNWKIGKIQPNSFISASNENEITTWAKIEYSNKYNVFYKYDYQCNAAFESLNQYTNNNKWELIFLNEIYKIILMI